MYDSDYMHNILEKANNGDTKKIHGCQGQAGTERQTGRISVEQ